MTERPDWKSPAAETRVLDNKMHPRLNAIWWTGRWWRGLATLGTTKAADWRALSAAASGSAAGE